MKIPKIKYKRTWFNPLYFILDDIIKTNPKVSTVLIYGGKSSAKTYTTSQLIAKKGIENRSDAIFFRKENARVKLTVKRTLVSAINSLRLQNGFVIQDFKVKSISGGELFLTGLDTEDKAKGAEGLSYVLMDELDQFTYDEFSQVEMSFRGEEAKILFGTWNPVSKNSWVKKDLVDTYEWEETKYKLPNPESFVNISSCGSVVLIKTNYKDNYWTVGSPCGTYGFEDEKLISKYNRLKKKDYNKYRINVLGEWGNANKGGEFYKHFKAEKQVRKHKYDPNLPLHISFDENVNPFLSLSVYQAEGLRSWKIDEICLEHPNNTLRKTLEAFCKKYSEHQEVIFIYGDATSRKQDTKLEKGQNFFTIIEDYLKQKGFRFKNRVPRSNPSVTQRGDFINDIFYENIYGIEFTIDENCTKSIDDFEFIKEDADGSKKKSYVTDPRTKVRYQEYGHLSDTDDYFICEYYKDQYRRYANINEDDRVYSFTEVQNIPKEAKKLPKGIYFGQFTNPTSLVELYLDGNDIYLNEVFSESDLKHEDTENNNSVVDRMNSIGLENGGLKLYKKEIIIGDKTGRVGLRSLLDNGYNVIGIKSGSEMQAQGIKTMNSYNVKVTSNSENIINAMNNWVRKTDNEGKLTDTPEPNEPGVLQAVRNVMLAKSVW